MKAFDIKGEYGIDISWRYNQCS